MMGKNGKNFLDTLHKLFANNENIFKGGKEQENGLLL